MLEIMNEVRAEVARNTGRSAWSKGVQAYANDLIDDIEGAIEDGWFDAEDLAAPKLVHKVLLNGADDWRHFSESACSLWRDADIAERLCTPSELKKCDGGNRLLIPGWEWIAVQARALEQADDLVEAAIKAVVAFYPVDEVE